nr:hypothetical protein [Tanacetum cinerariifolium]
MRTRRSVRISPLAYDPEVERSARLRRKAVRQFSTNLDFAGLKELFTEMSDDDATGAESLPRGVDSYFRPGNFEDPLPIVYLAAANGAVSNFKIQPNLIAILPMFRGHEEPYAHLREFFFIADTYQEFFEKLSKGSKTQASMDRNNNHTSSANFVSNRHGTNSEISELSKKVDILLRNLGKGVPNVSHVSHNACLMCGDPSHSVNNCQNWGAPSNEEVNGVYGNHPRNDPFSESYNPGWRNHPNFCWKDDDTYNRPNNTQQQNYGYKPRYEGGDSSYFQQNYHQQRPQQYQNYGQGQLAEEVHTREVDVPKPPTQNPKVTESPKDGEGGVSSTTTPYPEALEKSASTRLAKKGPHSEDMWETFKQVKINLPLIDAIKQIPTYAKFLKDLCTQKRKLKATFPKKIDLTEHVSAVLSSSLPLKFKDPGAPLISVMVGNITIKKALLDLGASINILPASLVDKYDLGTLRKTDTIISLADRSTKMPRGIKEDVIVKVDEFYYLVDFFVMDTESPYKDVQPTIILGR